MFDYRQEIERLTLEIKQLKALGIKDGKDYPVGEYCGALDAKKSQTSYNAKQGCPHRLH